VLLQAEVNSTDDEDEKKDDDRSPNEASAPKIEPEKLYPTAPLLDESSDANSTASAHSTSV